MGGNVKNYVNIYDSVACLAIGSTSLIRP